MPDEILRTFIAIELDEALRIAITRVQDKFKRQVPPGSVRWVAADGIHLTLKFLGDTPEGRVPEVEVALRRASAGIEPFEFSVEGRGCFPNVHRPRVIWVAVRDKRQALAPLQAAIEVQVAPLGWPTEARAFSPHLTLGRIARSATPSEQAAVGEIVEHSQVGEIGAQHVSGVSLIKSDLRPGGAVYAALRHVSFGQSSPLDFRS